MKRKIQKFIAESGYCSRRKAESLITEKKVKVNGKFAKIGMHVDEKDTVSVEGKTLRPIKKEILIALHKPKKYACTSRKIVGEKNIFSLIDIKERLFIVGRLDKNSRGLVLLTNNGDFAYKMTHPSFEHEKEYEVKLSKEISKEIEEKLKEGIDIGEKTPSKIKEIKRIDKKKYRVILTEGRNRQIRRMFEVFGCTILDLKRTRVDNYKLGKLKEKSWIFIEK